MSAGGRFVIAGAITYAVLRLLRGRGGVRVGRQELAASTAIGTALLLGGIGLVSIAERDVPSAVAALIIASVPLWVVVLRGVSGDRVGWATLLGVLAGFIGVAILVMPGPDGWGSPRRDAVAGRLNPPSDSGIWWCSGRSSPSPRTPGCCNTPRSSGWRPTRT